MRQHNYATNKYKVFFLLSFVVGGAHAETVLENLRKSDPTGVTAAAIEDAGRFAWNTLLSVPAAGNSVVYEFDTATGLLKRVQGSSGPLFTSRAVTIGKGRFSVNTSVIDLDFDQADGIGLQNGENAVQVETPLGVGTAISYVKSSSLVTQASLTYGIAQDVDLTFAVPVVSFDGQSRDEVFFGAVKVGEQQWSDDATSIGDILLRVKWVFLKRENWILGTEIGGWLPTGDEENQIGLEAFRLEPTMLFSTRGYRVNLHVNAGFNIGDTDDLRNEFRYKLGVDWALVEKLTLSAEILGRKVLDNDRVFINSSIFGVTGRADSHYNDGIAGLKWNPVGDVIVYASAIVALDDTGFRDDRTGVIGLEFNF